MAVMMMVLFSSVLESPLKSFRETWESVCLVVGFFVSTFFHAYPQVDILPKPVLRFQYFLCFFNIWSDPAVIIFNLLITIRHVDLLGTSFKRNARGVVRVDSV